MSFFWEEYLQVAKFVIKNYKGFSKEAGYRAAGSRAYYALYHMALKKAKEKSFFRPDDGKGHHRVLADSFKKEDPELSDTINDLRLFRNMCDYDNPCRFHFNRAPLMIERAQQAIKKLQNI